MLTCPCCWGNSAFFGTDLALGLVMLCVAPTIFVAQRLPYLDKTQTQMLEDVTGPIL